MRKEGRNTKQRDILIAISDRVIHTNECGFLVESSNGKKSCENEVKNVASALGKKNIKWDDIYITKLANVGYKLEYVNPTQKRKISEIKIEDLRSEITY